MRATTLLLCCAAGYLFCARPAQAIPAFARRTGQQCQMCHFRPPELNLDGQNFLRRGLREEPPEKPSEDTQPADVKQPIGVPLALNWANYLSAIGHHDYIAQTGERPQFNAGGLDLWIAGPITPHWTGLVNPSIDIENGGIEVDQGYGQYISRWADRFGSVRFGNRRPFAILFNQGGPSITLSPPVVLSTPADTGNTWTPMSFLRSLEAGGVGINSWNFYISAGSPRLEDSQTSQDGFENHTDICANAAAFPGFADSTVTAYYYRGHAWLSPTAPDNRFHRLGGFFSMYGPQTKLTAGYVAGRDKAVDGRDLDTDGAFGLVEGLIGEQWSAYFRYDWFSEDLFDGGRGRIKGPTVGASYWAATQVWLTMELQFLDFSNSRSINVFTTELDWAF